MSVIEERARGTIGPVGDETLEVRRHEKSLKIGVIGYGYWGPQLVRNFQDIPLTKVTMVADLDPGRLAKVSQTYPGIEVTQNYRNLFCSEVDAVIIATSPSTHYSLGSECLANGKHVLIEKPLARSRSEAQGLIDLAAARRLILMVGHTFEYNPAVETLRQLVASQAIGRVYYTNAVRTNLGIFQKDVNVLWDLAPHDISILMYVLGLDPIDVSASGQAYVQRGIHDVARLVVNFENQVQSHILVSWLDPCKVRRITVVGDKKMVVYDDVEPLEKIKVFDTGVDTPKHTDSYGEFQLSYRYGDITIPRIPPHEPLKVECSHFADCIVHELRPRSDGEVGLKVVKVLEAAEKSLLNSGGREPVEW